MSMGTRRLAYATPSGAPGRRQVIPRSLICADFFQRHLMCAEYFQRGLIRAHLFQRGLTRAVSLARRARIYLPAFNTITVWIGHAYMRLTITTRAPTRGRPFPRKPTVEYFKLRRATADRLRAHGRRRFATGSSQNKHNEQNRQRAILHVNNRAQC